MEKTKTKLVLEYSVHGYTTEKADIDDSWDRDNTATDFSPEILRLGTKGNNWCVETFEVDFPVEVGNLLFLVVVRYDTGDSFGYNENDFCFIGVYKEKEEAQKVRESIEDGSHELSYKWTGHFEKYRNTEVYLMNLHSEVQ